MIAWWWLIPAVIIGAFFGMILACLVSANGRD